MNNFDDEIRASNRWRKGTSGNPAGRPRRDFRIRELARTHSIAAIDKLFEIMTRPEYTPNEQICAAKAFLERALGKPKKHPNPRPNNESLADYFASLLPPSERTELLKDTDKSIRI